MEKSFYEQYLEAADKDAWLAQLQETDPNWRMAVSTIINLRTYKEFRAKEYGDLSEQLDLLWHSVNEGHFGEAAKTSPWFINIKSIKDKYPKPPQSLIDLMNVGVGE